MLTLVVRASLLTLVLMGASLVFADELVVTALILVTVALTAVWLLIGFDGADERSSARTTNKAGNDELVSPRPVGPSVLDTYSDP